MLQKKEILKSSLSVNKLYLFKKHCTHLLLAVFFFFTPALQAQQIANYVNNGGFEIPKVPNSQKAKFWDSIDSVKYVGLMLSYTISPFLVPNSSFTHQWPFKGNNYLLSTLLYKPNAPQTARGYPRNFLKQTLQNGKTYCVKFYTNVTDQTSYGVDGVFGAYFGNNTIDTITKCDKPISYLTPQIQHSGFITDTANWVLVTGTFVATGTEKYVLLGNFQSDAATNSLMINPTNSVLVFCDVLYDNVSCIDVDLPAYAGPDAWLIPGDSVFIGRQPDVGIDEACMWYQMPNTTTAIDTVAGLWVKPTVTTSYLVKQEICGNIKWDLVTIYKSGLGFNESDILKDRLSVFPIPTKDELNLSFDTDVQGKFNTIIVFNSLGQKIKEVVIKFSNQSASIKTDELPNGVYLFTLKGKNDLKISKRFIVTH